MKNAASLIRFHNSLPWKLHCSLQPGFISFLIIFTDEKFVVEFKGLHIYTDKQRDTYTQKIKKQQLVAVK